MDKSAVTALIAKHSSVQEGMRGMVASMCPLDLDEARLIEGIRSIQFEHKASTPSDDDEYWMAQSPFDGQWYIFASCPFVTKLPASPSYIKTDRPAWFDED